MEYLKYHTYTDTIRRKYKNYFDCVIWRNSCLVSIVCQVGVWKGLLIHLFSPIIERIYFLAKKCTQYDINLLVRRQNFIHKETDFVNKEKYKDKHGYDVLTEETQLNSPKKNSVTKRFGPAISLASYYLAQQVLQIFRHHRRCYVKTKYIPVTKSLHQLVLNPWISDSKFNTLLLS